jgi:hypothetical protein
MINNKFPIVKSCQNSQISYLDFENVPNDYFLVVVL